MELLGNDNVEDLAGRGDAMDGTEGDGRVYHLNSAVMLLGAVLLLVLLIVFGRLYFEPIPASHSTQNQTSSRTDRSDVAPSEMGKASWYDLEGKTASGEPMNDETFSAAHPSLPLGTKLHVENLGNGRSADVRINDRGPFVEDRIIDLSRAAAEKIGMMEDGVATVQVKKLGPPQGNR